jgi:peroxiredoxin
VELRDAFGELAAMDDVEILYVVADRQWTAKAERFVTAHRLGERVHFLVDPGSRAIDALRLRRPDPEPVEEGVPHPATYVLDRQGVVRFADVREDFHFWLDPALPLEALRDVP